MVGLLCKVKPQGSFWWVRWGGGLHILWFKVMLKELRVANTYKSNSRRPYTLIVQVRVHIRVST